MGQVEGGLGAQLEDRYFKQKVKLGQGSFGTVWRAVDRQTGNPVAVKQLDKASMPRRGVSRQDVDREITLMRSCRHENILQLLDTYEDSTSIYMALEYCDDGDFGDKLKELGLSIEERDAADWVRQMCDAVCVLHTQNICHRDIKPDNFMVHRRTLLKLSDFGLAVVIPRRQLIKAPCGTPAFNAPELHHLSKNPNAGYSFPVDMWAVGVSMYMVMFGGKHPFVENKKLDEGLLLQAKMDFRDQTSTAGRLGLGGVGGVGLRFSEPARQLCRRLVDPDPGRRLTASEAVYEPWLKLSAPRTPSRGRTPQHGPWTPQQRARTPQGQRPRTPQQRPPNTCTPRARSKLLPSTPRAAPAMPASSRNLGFVPTPSRARQRSASLHAV